MLWRFFVRHMCRVCSTLVHIWYHCASRMAVSLPGDIWPGAVFGRMDAVTVGRLLSEALAGE